MRQGTAVILALLLLASTTGAAMALHLHAANDGHSHDKCLLCLYLSLGATAVADGPAAGIVAPADREVVPGLVADLPPARVAHSPGRPRAPPTA